MFVGILKCIWQHEQKKKTITTPEYLQTKYSAQKHFFPLIRIESRIYSSQSSFAHVCLPLLMHTLYPEYVRLRVCVLQEKCT